MSADDVIAIAVDEPSIRRCWPVMRQLRPHLDENGFFAQVMRQQREGYVLASLSAGGEVRAVAGFRIIEMLSRGRHMYVDDLVTDEAARSSGYGARLMAWLEVQARQAGCQRLDLDSGVQRFAAHRFYFLHRLVINAYHFSKEL